jgi:hypothetical protein
MSRFGKVQVRGGTGVVVVMLLSMACAGLLAHFDASHGGVSAVAGDAARAHDFGHRKPVLSQHQRFHGA